MLFAGAQTTLRIGWTVGLSVIFSCLGNTSVPMRLRVPGRLSQHQSMRLIQALVVFCTLQRGVCDSFEDMASLESRLVPP